MRGLKALAAAAVASLAAAACAPSSLPLTRVTPLVDQAGQAGDASTPATIGPLGQRMTPDVWVRSADSLAPGVEQRLAALVPAGHASALRVGRVSVNGGAAVAAGVDPAVFRAFTPQGTAEVTPVWDAVAAGEAAVSYDAAKRFGLALGGSVMLGGVALRVGALADTALPDLDVVVSDAVADRLGLGPANAVVLSLGGPDPAPLAMTVRKAVTKADQVELLRTADRLSFLAGTSAARRFGTLRYQVNPDRSVVVDPAWVAANIVTAPVPILGRVTCHRLMIPQLSRALGEIQARGLADKIHPDQYEGCYWPKLIEDSDHLSMHAWGLALDINVPTNQRGTMGDMDPQVVAIFKRWGFRWGGDWHDVPDPMHFELAALLQG